MKPQGDRQFSGKLVKVLLTLGLAVIMLGTVWSFTWAAQAGGDSPASAREGREALDAASVGFTLTAKAEAPDGSVYDASNDGDIVYNGDVLTYTISLCNEDATAITNVLVNDELPENALDNRTIACSGDCDMIGDGEYVPVPSGVTILITITRRTLWSFASIGPGECVNVSVWGRVIGQSAGTELINEASTNVGLERYLSSEVGERPPDAGVGLPEVPSWLSDDFGGTIDQDWGDFDRDGDLDLVLGSSLGATIYRNEGGDLESYWQAPYYTSEDDPRHAYGVRWADLDGDPEQRLELVVVGNSVDHALEGQGVNYIYTYNESATEPEQRFMQTNVFTSSLQLVRVAPADYDGDGDVDLIASANAINASCAVRLYRNGGTGNFIGETEPNVDGNVWYPCVSNATGEDATAALGPVDYDNDGDVDLAIGAFPSTLRLLINQRQGEVFTNTNPFLDTIVLEADLEYIPYGLAWGDYDLDGYLDLAAAYPLQRKVYVYHNEVGDLGQRVLVHAHTLRMVSFMAPLSVDWGDFDGDGWLDLAMADSSLALFLYDQTEGKFVRADYLGRPASGGQVWSIRAVDLENRGSLALVATNRDGFSRLFDAESSKLKSTMQPVDGGQMKGVAWGDWNGDGSVDLLFGGILDEWEARLYLNDEGVFLLEESFANFGPHTIAFGDITGDGELDIVVGKKTSLQVYDNDGSLALFVSGTEISSLALGDFDDNEVLDILVGRVDGAIDLYLLSFSGGTLSVLSSSSIVAAGGPSVSDLAVGDYDGDNYLDFAAGFDGGGAHVYRNFGNSTFDSVWPSASSTLPTRAVTWGDYDGDNDLDLAVGNYGTDDYVWRNDSGAFSSVPIWTSTTTMTLTTSMAWGDWNNDGYPDLAVGKDGDPDIVYANLGSGADYLALVQMWRSDESYATTDVAWGDRDGDGDLDLAISQAGVGGASGFYENTLAVPAHIAASEVEAAKLPATPPYVYVDRPGDTCDAYLYSSSEILGNPGVTPPHVVTITYRLYDLQEDPVVSTDFEYSLDGEVWLPATPYPGSPSPITATNGVSGIFVWNAFADGAVGEYARFRVRVVTQEATGPTQRAVGVGVSPPFRVRAQNCTWPEISLSFITDTKSSNSQQVCYTFTVAYTANGTAYFDWDLDGDGIYEDFGTNGNPMVQCYAKPLYYTDPSVRLRTPLCPGRPAFDRVTIGGPRPPLAVYMPLVLHGADVGIADDATASTLSASSAGKEWWESGASPAGDSIAVNLDVADYSTVPGSVGATSKVTMFALGVNSQPAINSDGSRIAFWSTGEWTGQNPDGSIEIFVAEPGEFGRVTYAQVTSSTGSVLGGFSLSPSMDDAGERLVFFSDMDNGENGDRNFEIFMADIAEVSATGVTVTQVTHTPRGVSILPDISGDGTYIAFASDNDLTGDSVDQFSWGQLEIYRAKVVGEAITFQRVTTTTEEFAINDKPSISGDGRFIAFVSNQDVTGQLTNTDGNLEVFVAEIGQGGEVTYTQVTSTSICVNDDPSINADGTSIAYLSDCYGGNYDIYLWSAGSDIDRITETDEDEDHPSISADGLRVAYTRDRKLYLYDVIEDEVIAPLPSRPGGIGFNAYPVLSADGSNVAFNHDWDIYVARYPLADLALSKTVSSDLTDVDEIFTYTLTITNIGPSPAPGVVLTDTLPSGVEPAQSYAGEQWDDTDLILMLHLDEDGGATTFVDATGYNNDAGCSGGNCPTMVPGKVGNALWFNGSQTDEYIVVDSMNSFPETEITVMFWMKTTQTAWDNTPFSYAVPGSMSEVRICDVVGWDIWFGGRASYVNPPSLANGEWHHVAVTWRSSDDRVQIYHDGELRATKYIWRYPHGYKLTDGGSLVLGQNQVYSGFDHYFSGTLDEVAVYRRILSSNEVYSVYLAQGGESDPENYTSPVMAQPTGASGWSAISWMPSRPVGVDLPDYGSADPDGYLTGTVAMTGNVFLMHMNEPSGYQGFLDTSGEGNDGYCAGTECPVAGVGGKLGSALSFDGVDDYVNVGPAESLEMDDYVSIEAWVYPTDATGGIIVNKEGEYEVAIMSGTVQWAFANSSPGWAWVDTGATVPLNQWTHVAVIYNLESSGARTVTTYVNGALVDADTVVGGIGDVHTGYNDFRIGGRQIGTQFFTGRIDEVAVFDRALSGEEVLNHYLRGALKVEFDVRACNDPLCDVETFSGPYPDHTDPTIFPPAFAIDVSDDPYFQYRVTSVAVTVAGTVYGPELQWVEVHPWVECSSGTSVVCTVGTPIAPLDTGESVSVVLPVVVPKTAVFSSSSSILTNTAIVDSLASDHETVNDKDHVQSALDSDCWVRLNDEDVYFVNLQAAVDAAPEGATLRVAGTCGGEERRGGTAQSLYLTKTVTIQGGYTATNNLAGPPDPTIYTTTLHAGGQGGVVVIKGDVSPTLEGLHITGGAPITDSVGGGIRVVTATVTISGCRVYSNTSVERGGGIYLANGGAVLFNNVIQSNIAGQDGGGVYLIGSHLAMTNTVLATNQAGGAQGGRGGGVYVAGSQTQLSMLHTTIVGNVAAGATAGWSGDGVYVANGSVAMTNTIVADHDAESYSVGIYQYPDRGSVSLEAVLWWNNTLDYDIDGDPSRDYEGDPLFVDAAAGNYRIQAGSKAVDRAVETEALSDLDGHPRGVKPDLGAYESPYGIAVTKSASRGIVEPGDALTYTIYVTNTGYLPLTGLVLTDTLPTYVTAESPAAPSGVLTWTLGSLQPGVSWSPPPVVVVNVSSVYTGVLTNAVTVSASELVTASADVQVTVSAENGDLPWVEDFDLPDLTTHDAGPTAWSIDDSDLGSKAIFYVQNDRFKSSRTEGEGVWISGPIDVHDTSEVDVSIKLLGTGSLEAGGRKGDYIRVYYRLDGGPKVLIIDREGPFNGAVWETVEVRGIVTGGAETIQIVICTRTTGPDEFYYWDNVTVSLFPEMEVGGNGVLILDGDESPSVDDDTDFGTVVVTGTTAVTHTFTITNTGNGALNLTGTPRVEITGAPVGVFTVTQQPSTPVAPSGGTTTFTIKFDPASAATYTATVSIDNNDTDEDPYDFVIEGTGTAPEIAVRGNGNLIPDGDASPSADDGTDFGDAAAGSGSVEHTFTIRNSGNGELNLTGTPRVQILDDPAGVFTVTQQPSTPVAPSGGTTTFKIKFEPVSTTTYTATVSIANDDENEDPYDFVIQGTGTAPEMEVGGNGVLILDGDDSPSTIDGTHFGTVVVTGTDAVTHTFTITNTGNGALNLTSIPRVEITGAPAGVFVVTQQPSTPVAASGGTTTFVIVFKPASTTTYTATVSIANNDTDRNPYDFVIEGTGTAPEMEVGGNGVLIPDGDISPTTIDGTDFGNVVMTGTVTVEHTFTITNTGDGALYLTGTPRVQITGAPAGVFTVTQQPSTPVAASGGTTTFVIVFDPASATKYTATVSITNNDDGNGYIYTFNITGTGTQ